MKILIKNFCKYPEFVWREAIQQNISIEKPFYDLDKKERSVAYAMIVDRYKTAISKPQLKTKSLIEVNIQTIDEVNFSTHVTIRYYTVDLIPNKYTLAKKNKLLLKYWVAFGPNCIKQELRNNLAEKLKEALGI